MDWYLFSTLVFITVMAMCPERELEIEQICNPKYGHSCCFFCRCNPQPSIL
jgi:hypothetical protein